MKSYLFYLFIFIVSFQSYSTDFRNEESNVITQLNADLKELNALTHLVIEFSQIAVDDHRKNIEYFEEIRDMQLKEIAQVEGQIVDYEGHRDAYMELIKTGLNRLKSLNFQLTDAKKKSENSQTKKIQRCYIHMINGINKYIASTKQSNALLISEKKRFDNIIASLRAQLSMKKADEITYTVNTGLMIPDDALIIFRIFSGDLSAEELEEKLQEISLYLVLRASHFTRCERIFVEDQVRYGTQVLDFLLEARERFYNIQGVEKKHVEAFIRAVELIKEIFSRELMRRDLKARFLEQEQIKPNDDTDLAPLEYDDTTSSEGISDEESSSNIENSDSTGSWKVLLSHRLDKNFSDILAPLKECLSKGPRISKDDAIDFRLSNFSGLSTGNDFHCHVNNSNKMVAVWKVLSWENKVIELYYFGKHPNTYLKILKKAKNK